MGLDCYILDENKQPIKATVDQFAAYLSGSQNKRRVNYTSLHFPNGIVTISTVFLCLDHKTHVSDKPKIFETLISSDAFPHIDGIINRTSTWEEAEQSHESMIEEVVQQLGNCKRIDSKAI